MPVTAVILTHRGPIIARPCSSQRSSSCIPIQRKHVYPCYAVQRPRAPCKAVAAVQEHHAAWTASGSTARISRVLALDDLCGGFNGLIMPGLIVWNAPEAVGLVCGGNKMFFWLSQCCSEKLAATIDAEHAAGQASHVDLMQDLAA